MRHVYLEAVMIVSSALQGARAWYDELVITRSTANEYPPEDPKFSCLSVPVLLRDQSCALMRSVTKCPQDCDLQSLVLAFILLLDMCHTSVTVTLNVPPFV